METRPLLDSLFCINPDCKLFKQPGANNLKVRKLYGRDRIRYLRCRCCGTEFSERKGTPLFNSKIPETKAESVIDHIDRGCGLLATSQLVGVCKETVSRLIRLCGQASRSIHDSLVCDLTPAALQFDEKWSFTRKKRKKVTDQDDPQQVGDRWDINCIDPVTKLLITLVPGPRNEVNIHKAVRDAASRLSDSARLPAIFTDGEKAYEEAILLNFGNYYRAPRSSLRGRPPSPIVRVPQGLVYAQVVKQRSNNRVVGVEIRPIFGKGKLKRAVEELGWKKANTSAIERYNLTDRNSNARKGRKTLKFSKRARYHDWTSYINGVWYNFQHYHRSLRRRVESGQWERRTPAMAAGLVDHKFSTLELLRLCPVGLG